MMEQLLGMLTSIDQKPQCIGDRIIIQPTGGRVIGLFPDKTHNALWENPALGSRSDAKTLFSDSGWKNYGGIRAWISPEAETNIADPEKFWESYEVPAAMDPAEYQLVDRDDISVTLKTDLPLYFHRHNARIHLELTRRFSVMNHEVEVRNLGVSAVGIRIESVLCGVGALPATVRPALWNLIQVPGGGRITIPLSGPTTPRAFIGEPSYSTDGVKLTCKVRTDASFKFGLQAECISGSVFYHRRDGEYASLLVSRNAVLDRRFYSDYPVEDPSETGYVQQFYVDDGGLGRFGEIEYHSACIEPNVRNEVADKHEVIAYFGEAGAIDSLCAELVPG